MMKGRRFMASNEGKKAVIKIKTLYEGFCGLLLFIAVTISMAEIVSRIVFKTSIDLFFDFSVWITAWAFMLIAGPLLAEGGHISIDFLRVKLGGWKRRVLEVCLALITLIYCVLFTWAGILFNQQLVQRQSVFPRYVAIPKWIVELCVPIGMFIFTVFAVIEVVKAVRKRW
jgi:TRAP-type C4-dicarboxylate transport system permease small subunit